MKIKEFQIKEEEYISEIDNLRMVNAQLNKELDMISIGPDIENSHTIRETLYLNSIPRIWNLLEGILQAYQ